MRRIQLVHRLPKITKRILSSMAHALIGASVLTLIIFILYLENRPDLNVWHEVKLDTEFTTKSQIGSFTDYVTLEEQLFTQLDQRVYVNIKPAEQHRLNRFHRGSLSDPARWPRNWNRSFELPVASPQAGILLLHGMSDSPYSLRTIGQRLHQSGAWVVGLRLPGHGTAPAGLVDVRWQDMAAAVRLAMQHLRNKVGKQPIYIVGYSNGGALAVHYALITFEEDELPKPAGLILVSPAIGVTRLAAFAIWQARIGHLLGLKKLEWTTILPEYDPFKYNSFTANAGDQVYRLTQHVQSRFASLTLNKLQQFPKVLAFQSAVDATVSTPALIEGLFAHLPAADHELVLFDINRTTEIETMLTQDPRQNLKAMLQNKSLGLALSLVTNENNKSLKVMVRHKQVGETLITESPLNMQWPAQIYSLSHVSLSFSPHDPLYGKYDDNKVQTIRLGNIALRGERGILQVPAADILRLRWNPFYPYVEKRILEFVGLPNKVRHTAAP